MNELIKVLQMVGLNQAEMDIYGFLYQNGPSTASTLNHTLRLEKTAFYRAIKSLKEKKLIDSLGEIRNQKFRITNPERIFEIYKKKKSELEETGKSLKKILTNFTDYRQSKYLAENIKIFEGENAYYLFREEILKEKNCIVRTLQPNDFFSYMAAQGMENYQEDTKTFIPKRLKRGISFRIMYDANVDTSTVDFQYKTNPVTMKEARQIPFKLNFRCSMDTFGDKTAFMNVEGKKYWVMIIKDRLVTDLMNSMFDVLWSQASVVKLSD
jgi:sugar-specific transcriptional regulator TrmB